MPPAVPSAQESPLASVFQQLRVRGHKTPMGMMGASFSSALEAVWSHRTRSLLTTLGIFIGVTAVIGVLTLTQGVGAYFTNIVSGLGANTIIIQPGTFRMGGAVTRQSSSSLTVRDVQSLAKVSHVTAISPIIESRTQVVYSNQNWRTAIEGVILICKLSTGGI